MFVRSSLLYVNPLRNGGLETLREILIFDVPQRIRASRAKSKMQEPKRRVEFSVEILRGASDAWLQKKLIVASLILLLSDSFLR